MWDHFFVETTSDENFDSAIDSETSNLIWLNSSFAYKISDESQELGGDLKNFKSWLYLVTHNRERGVAIAIPVAGTMYHDRGAKSR